MPYRVSFFFAQQNARNCGWSENLYNNAISLQAAINAAVGLVPYMLACRANPVQLPYLRVSTVGVQRQVQIINLPLYTWSTSVSADYQNTALLMMITAAGGYLNRQWLRGIDDAAVQQAGTYTPFPSLTSALQSLQQQLTQSANTWCLQKLMPVSTPVKINNISATGQVTTATPHGLAAGNNLRIAGVSPIVDWNGQWRIATIIDGNNFQLVAEGAWPVGTPGFRKAQLYPRTYAYPAISSFTVQRATSHRTGRPFGLATGRRRKATA